MSDYRYKYRSRDLFPEVLEYDRFTETWSDTGKISHHDHQRTFTRGNLTKRLGKDPIQDIGGFFNSQRVEVDVPTGAFALRRYNFSNTLTHAMDGVLVPHLDVANITFEDLNADDDSNAETWIKSLTPNELSVSELNALGSTAVSRAAPTNPLVDGLTALLELVKDGLPSMIGRSGNVGSEWLNWNFAVMPLFSDLNKFREIFPEADAIVNQLHRDSGRIVRRRLKFPDVTEVTNWTDGPLPCLFSEKTVPQARLQTQGPIEVTQKKTTEVWFSGAFTYHLPRMGFMRRVHELDRLYGIIPGLDTAWELMPWSWLVDYFTNVGDVIRNVNAFALEGLVMPYGYIMCRQSTVTRYTWSGLLNFGSTSPDTPHRVIAEVRAKTLQRQPATPFGFGASLDLSPKQLSILAALGISRK